MKKILLKIMLILLFSGLVYSQTTSIKLPTVDSTSSFIIFDSSGDQLFSLGAGGSLLLENQNNPGAAVPAQGAGGRFMWLPQYYAIRGGFVISDQWDSKNIGGYSTAFGRDVVASGDYSVALGNGSKATASDAVALGNDATVSGYRSLAFGLHSTVTAGDAIALGRDSHVSDNYGIAIGNNVTVAANAIAIGSYLRADASNAFALGSNASSNGKNGSFVIGDATGGDSLKASLTNSMNMRFSGGYKLYTDISLTNGVELFAGGSSWSSISDSTKKENFVDADGEYFLNSISKLKLGSWNYKSQDPKEHRHYGPMAQEIFRYFGKDKYGTIGNDTTVASADMDGIIFIALQALEKRTSELDQKTDRIDQLQKVIATQGNKIEELQNKVEQVRTVLNELNKKQHKGEYKVAKNLLLGGEKK